MNIPAHPHTRECYAVLLRESISCLATRQSRRRGAWQLRIAFPAGSRSSRVSPRLSGGLRVISVTLVANHYTVWVDTSWACRQRDGLSNMFRVLLFFWPASGIANMQCGFNIDRLLLPSLV